MNYQYIEQLLERYWECQTTLEEEAILRNFFAQADIPASLIPYATLFKAENQMAEESLGEEFDERVLAVLKSGEEQDMVAVTSVPQVIPLPVKNGWSEWVLRLRPLWRAAAIVAIVLTIGMAAQQGFRPNEENNISEAQIHVMLPGDSTEVLPTGEVLEAVLSNPSADSIATMTPSK